MNRRNLLIGGGAAVAAVGGVSFSGMGSPQAYADAMADLRTPLRSDAAIHESIRYATLAANGHNTQPWRFQIADKAVRITPDVARRTPAVDPDDHHLYVSLGCAAENLSLAASAMGSAGAWHFDPAGEGAITFEYIRGEGQQSVLCDAIPRRQSTRAPFDGRAVSSADLATLAETAWTPSVDLTLLTERAQIDRVRDLVIAGNNVQMADRAFLAEFKSWMRFNPHAALWKGDGLFSGASGNPALPTWLGQAMFDAVFTAKAENEKYVAQLAGTSGIAVFVGEQATPANWVQIGRACQRFALQATALGMKLSFINQPVEVPRFRSDLAVLAGHPGKRPDILMRFGYGGPALPMSPRRPVREVATRA